VLAEKTAGLESAATETEARKVGITRGRCDQTSKPTVIEFQESADRDHLLAALRSARAKFAAYLSDLDSIGIALKTGVAGVDETLAQLEAIGAMCLFQVQERPGARCSR
jgi:hypothetical protein